MKKFKVLLIAVLILSAGSYFQQAICSGKEQGRVGERNKASATD